MQYKTHKHVFLKNNLSMVLYYIILENFYLFLTDQSHNVQVLNPRHSGNACTFFFLFHFSGPSKIITCGIVVSLVLQSSLWAHSHFQIAHRLNTPQFSIFFFGNKLLPV